MQGTDSMVWLVAGVVFVAVVATVVAAGLLWERRREARGWRHIADELRRIGGSAPEAVEAVELARGERGAHGQWAEALLRRLPMRARLERLLEQAASPWSVPAYLMRVAAAAAGTGLVLLLVGSWTLALVGALIGAALPYLRLVQQRKRRLARFEENLPDAIGLLTRAVRAGHPFSSGLKMMADEAREPIAGEFRRVFEEQKFGLPLQESLLGLAARVDLVDVRMFVIAVLVQREVGGSLAEILEEIAETIRERLKIRRQVKVFTAQGRMTGLMLSLLPIGLGVVLGLLNPNYMRLLVSEPLGQAMLGAAAVMQMIGYVAIRRITNIEV